MFIKVAKIVSELFMIFKRKTALTEMITTEYIDCNCNIIVAN